jgi:NAD-dependent deacetylase
MEILYITGAGVSADSGIPTFRGKDGFWSIGSKNYTPQEMATRHMYESNPGQFLLWYYKRFAKYRKAIPNLVHRWLADKNLITQNIDGLDGKAGNSTYIPIHGRLDKVTKYVDQGIVVPLLGAPWENISAELNNEGPDSTFINDEDLVKTLLQYFEITKNSDGHFLPLINLSLKPFVLLFDEFYTDLYKINEVHRRLLNAKKMVFMGTSFSVNITTMALDIAIDNNIEIEIVDPQPINIGYKKVRYFRMSALEYISNQ